MPNKWFYLVAVAVIAFAMFLASVTFGYTPQSTRSTAEICQWLDSLDHLSLQVRADKISALERYHIGDVFVCMNL